MTLGRIMNRKHWNIRELREGTSLGMSPAHVRAIEAAAEQVRRRTGCRAWIDSVKETVVFGFVQGEHLILLFDVPLFRSKGVPATFDPVLDRHDVEDVCYVIGLARESKRRKLRQIWCNEQNEAMDAREELGQLLEESKRDWLDRQETARRSSLVMA